MQVILRESVEHLGELGDIVNVKAGYARNFLLPRGLAVQANDRQVNRFEHERRLIEAKLAKLKVGAQADAAKLTNVTLRIEKAAGENNKLFGSVTAMEIEALLREQGYPINRKQLQLKDQIKAIGTFKVEVKLHRDVHAAITVNVVAAPGTGMQAVNVKAAAAAEESYDADEAYED